MPVYLTSIKDSREAFIEILDSELKLSEATSKMLVDSIIQPYLNPLSLNISLVIETHYIDKVYRDSYYTYYSSKLKRYKRNCIKVSLFDMQIEEDDFISASCIDDLQKNYLGFFVIRPTSPSIIGRSVISPKALKVNNIQICTVNVGSTANAVKFNINGFPHSSQDSETITCAETTIWALMEYFGHKYPEYKPVLPSKIHAILNSVSYQRLLPSKGLEVNQISYALRELGFATRIYSRGEYGADFDNLLSVYIESGIPLVIALDNIRYKKSNPNDTNVSYIGHAALCIGHELAEDTMLESLMPINTEYTYLKEKMDKRNLKIFDYNDLKRKYVFIDDNLPVYQKAYLEKPTIHYNDASWDKCEISHFIAPLYKKNYLEAFEVKNFIFSFLVDDYYSIGNNREVVVRTFLASTRSYKHYVALNPNMDNEMKYLITEEKLPKFIWVTELSTKALITEKKANGLIILDATEPNLFNNKALIIAFYPDIMIKYTEKNRIFEKITLSLRPFSICEDNLRNIS
jgi:hypothetical protein